MPDKREAGNLKIGPAKRAIAAHTQVMHLTVSKAHRYRTQKIAKVVVVGRRTSGIRTKYATQAVEDDLIVRV